LRNLITAAAFAASQAPSGFFRPLPLWLQPDTGAVDLRVISPDSLLWHWWFSIDKFRASSSESGSWSNALETSSFSGIWLPGSSKWTILAVNSGFQPA